MSGPVIGLIGARRTRQGLGPFVARELHAAGAAVACVVGTHPETAQEARRQLRDEHRIDVRSYADVDTMLSRERLDAVAILSPNETHERYLERALSAGLHVLCEKPLVWGVADLAKRATSLVDRFADRGLLLWENCQWPYTLPAFRELHPELGPDPPARFSMELSPTSSGSRMLGDSLPHPLSMLQALLPGTPGEIVSPRFDVGPERTLVGFEYRAANTPIAVEIALTRTAEFPRPAAYAIDGRQARRRVRLPDYEQSFSEGDRSVTVPDPLRALIRGFLGELRDYRGGAPARRSSSIADRMALLQTLVTAFETGSSEGEPPPGW